MVSNPAPPTGGDGDGADAVAAETPTARVPVTGTNGRPPLHERLLDAEELDQLQVLRGAVEPSAPIHGTKEGLSDWPGMNQSTKYWGSRPHVLTTWANLTRRSPSISSSMGRRSKRSDMPMPRLSKWMTVAWRPK
jgi:hypothetical protein